MNIFLGNILFHEVEKTLGYKLTDEDKKLWDKYHSDDADVKSATKSCFHIFDLPKSIVFKGEEAKQAILKMFTKDKLISPKGQFAVYDADQK